MAKTCPACDREQDLGSHMDINPGHRLGFPGTMVKNATRKSGLRLGDCAFERKLAGVYYIQSSLSLIPLSRPMKTIAFHSVY